MSGRDIVIMGGGIAGASLARGLASAGLDVLVLEASEQFEDRVRGEGMHLWGVREARDLGVEQVLLDAGAHVAPLWRQYTAGTDGARDMPMSLLMPGIDGTLNLHHPVACGALLDAAAAAGAAVARGVRDVKLSWGPVTSVSYRVGRELHEVTTGLVVGADGRTSTVRKQAGIGLERQEPSNYIAGVLLDGLDGVPADHDALVGEEDLFFILFHQGCGRARAYFAMGLADQHRFSGPGGTERFMAATRLSAFPWSEQVASATPAGPCATYAGDDTWTATPYAEGVVLVGDAAGYNDPIIGEGLSIAMRDARMVRDLVLAGARTPADFRPYGDERAERMRRLRLLADVLSVTQVEDGGDHRARRAWLGTRMDAMDSEVFPLLVGAFTGPETIPPELVDERILDRIRSADRF